MRQNLIVSTSLVPVVNGSSSAVSITLQQADGDSTVTATIVYAIVDVP